MRQSRVISRQFVLLGSLLAVFALAGASVLSVSDHIRQIEASRGEVVRETEETWIPLLTRAVWILSEDDIRAISLAILNQEYVEALTLKIHGLPSVNLGTPSGRNAERFVWPIVHPRGAETVRVATLEVITHAPTILEVAAAQLPRTLLPDLLKVAVILLPVFLLVHLAVTLPLSRLRGEIAALTAGLDGERIGDLDFRRRKLLKETDELDELVHAFNSLLASIREERGIRLERERDLENSLSQSRFLLREVHHRVKNNLQMLISLFNLHAQRLGDAERAVMMDAESRIRSLALVHIQLYQEESVTSVDLVAYAELLLHNLAGSLHGGDVPAVRTSVAGDRIELPLDIAIPLALVLNELATNAVKHAFEPDRPGSLSLNVKRCVDRVVVTLCDDGRGLPSDFSLTGSANFGLTVVATLLDQINAEIGHEDPPGGGACFRIAVPIR